MILVYSVQHTATWSTIDWLLSKRQVDGFAEIRHLPALLEGRSTAPSPIEHHWGKNPLLHCHVGHDYRWGDGGIDRAQLALAMSMPVVIPMLDPLLSCLSALHRLMRAGHGVQPRQQLARWLTLAKSRGLLYHGRQHPLVEIPWDLIREDERMHQMVRFSEALGLRDDEADKAFCAEWPMLNSQGFYEAKRRYHEGDYQWLLDNFPGVCSELARAEPVLRPWLIEVGYKNLMWWTL